MTSAEALLGRVLLWSGTFAGAAVLGLPAYRAPGSPGLVALAGVPAGTVLFLLLAGAPPPGPGSSPARIRAAVIWRLAYLGAAAAFEELLWRGIALAALAIALGPLGALAATSAAFAAWHHATLGRRAAVHLLTGVFFGGLFLYGGLPVAILAHATYNFLVDQAVRSGRPQTRGGGGC